MAKKKYKDSKKKPSAKIEEVEHESKENGDQLTNQEKKKPGLNPTVRRSGSKKKLEIKIIGV